MAEKCCTALLGGKAKRPDFLIYVPTIGHTLIDVKSRTLAGFGTSEKMFYMSNDEVDSLFRTQSFLIMPLWIAFVNKEDKTDNPIFFLVPLTIIKQYKDRLQKECGINNIFDCLFIRIPNEFSGPINEIKFFPEINSFNLDRVQQDKVKYLRLFEEIRDVIANVASIDKKIILAYIDEKSLNHIMFTEAMNYFENFT